MVASLSRNGKFPPKKTKQNKTKKQKLKPKEKNDESLRKGWPAKRVRLLNFSS